MTSTHPPAPAGVDVGARGTLKVGAASHDVWILRVEAARYTLTTPHAVVTGAPCDLRIQVSPSTSAFVSGSVAEARPLGSGFAVEVTALASTDTDRARLRLWLEACRLAEASVPEPPTVPLRRGGTRRPRHL